MHDDIKTFSDWWKFAQKYVQRIDLIAGGFPCQPFSVAGKQRGTEDDRWLWPEFCTAIEVVKPRYVLIENVSALLTHSDGNVFTGILDDLDSLGFDAEWSVVSVATLGFPYNRDRVFILAYANGNMGKPRNFKPQEHWREVGAVSNVAEAADRALASFATDGREADGSSCGMAVARPNSETLDGTTEVKDNMAVRGGLVASMHSGAGNAVNVRMAYAIGKILTHLDECLNAL